MTHSSSEKNGHLKRSVLSCVVAAATGQPQKVVGRRVPTPGPGRFYEAGRGVSAVCDITKGRFLGHLALEPIYQKGEQARES